MPPPQLPPEAPLAMPIQPFGGRLPADIEVARFRAPPSPHDILGRRVLLVLLTCLLATAALTAIKTTLGENGIGFWDVLVMIQFFPLFAWVAFGFINATVGFVLLMLGKHPGYIPAPRPTTPFVSRTAVLVPIHNEDVDAVFGRVERMARSLDAFGAAAHFDFFLLSDSGVDAGPIEEAAWRELAQRAPVAVYYRRRVENIGRKPGNVADWVRRFGAAYDHMLVVDADSLMSGQAMAGMVHVMEQRPTLALLQTVPTVIGATTFFQRWMQFANRLYGPVASTGLVWWSGAESTFWGHNALIRTEAFASSCGLPDLAGPPPFGGPIMSHDMVEAALLRRRGWAVHMIMIDESYEEFPPTLIDLAVRDRRWAQGNIQHVALLGASGFHWISRLQLLIGASAFITSPLWMLLILTTVVQALVGNDEAIVRGTSFEILEMTLVLLFAPKFMSGVWAMMRADRRADFGGARGIWKSIALDIPLSMLMAPVTMITQTLDLISIFRGRRSGWHPQNRDRDGLSMADVMPRYRWHLVAGVALLLITPFVPATALMLTPITLGLLVAPWLAQWTASARRGAAFAARGFFTVPPERIP
ncbi:glucans biosynthesis glucosyltransferase MdoH [Sphingomonas koreensis]|nr:glucans biosynthesis glucosyltransferase MdoH [Sphingomonas koreensis]